MSRGLQGFVHAEDLHGPTGLNQVLRRYGTQSVTAAIHAQDARLSATAGPFTFGRPIVTGGLAALGGSVEVTVNPDQSIRWKGHMHDSGADGYDFSISAIVRSPTGHAVAVAKSGSVGGTFTSGDRDFDWDETTAGGGNVGPVADYAGMQLETHLEYESDIGSTLEAAVSWLVKFAVGAALGSAGGIVVFVGMEIGSLISAGSLVPGARMAEGILWMAGPTNTLFAIACEGIAQLGSRERALTQEEYDFANQVFLGAMPPRDKIRLTDTIGGGNRAFTFPRYDGKITLNMGQTAWDDPRRYRGEARNADGTLGTYGRTFIHEMTHAAQIHFSTQLDYLARGLSAKVCEVSGSSPYTYGPAGPDWLDAFNMEQQAQIVGDWANAVVSSKQVPNYQTSIPADINSQYFRYIQEFVRTGRY
jgi:hypothetical protein